MYGGAREIAIQGCLNLWGSYQRSLPGFDPVLCNAMWVLPHGGTGQRAYNYITYHLLFRVAEVHRTDETTATPCEEGANLSESIEQ